MTRLRLAPFSRSAAQRAGLCVAASLAIAIAGPCDIYATAGTPCTAAHSMVRALYAGYSGGLYQLKRFGDNATLDIHPLQPGGVADTASHDRFCASNPRPKPGPTPPSPPHGIPPLGSKVFLEPVAMPGSAFRHCDYEGYVTPRSDKHGESADHVFTLVSALSGTPYAFSFESTNYPGMYIAPMPANRGRPGIVKSPDPGDASWAAAPSPGGGYTLTSLSTELGPRGVGLSVAVTLNGSCSQSYSPPSKGAAITTAPNAWRITLDSGGGGGGGGYPQRADCVVWRLYDQTGNGNHLLPATPAINNPAYDLPVNATRHPISLAGRKVYGAYFETGMGYRAQNTTGVAVGNDPETIYMVTSGTHVNSGCCFDYGNSEDDCTNPKAFCDGCMEAVYFGTGYGGKGEGPWVGADLENGIYGGPLVNSTFLRSPFVTAMVKGGTDGFATKGADATSGPLHLLSNGSRPEGYQPMHKTGAIILGVGGDNLAGPALPLAAPREAPIRIPGMSIGTFYEGLLTAGYSTEAADAAVQADIVAAGYGK